MTSLFDITTKIGSGATPRGGKSVYQEAGTRFIRSQNVLDFSTTDSGMAFIDDTAAVALRGVQVLPGDVLVNITGDSVARVAQWRRNDDARVSQHVAIVRADPRFLDGRYLQYWLLSPSQKSTLLTLASSGGSRPALTKAMLGEMRIETPRLAEQRAIAELLGALDDKIAANRRIAELADELIRAEYLELPKSWTTLGDLATHERSPVEAGKIDSNATYLGLEHFDHRTLWLSRRGQASEITSAKSQFQTGDTLFGRLRPYFHKVSTPSVSGVCSTEVMVLRPKRPELASLVAAASSCDEVIDLAVQNSNGTRMPRAKWTDISDMPVPDPESTDVLRFISRSDAMKLRCWAALRENEQLAATRDELLPLLMNGTITVKDAEARVEEEV